MENKAEKPSLYLDHRPPRAKDLKELQRRWSCVRDREVIAVTVLVLDMGGSSVAADVLGPINADEVIKRFRTAIGEVADRWGAYPIRNFAGDATALFFWNCSDAVAAAIDVLSETSTVRRRLGKDVLTKLNEAGARGFRIGGAYGEVVFDREPGSCTGNPLNIAGHIL